jgi:hypothetical protein
MQCQIVAVAAFVAHLIGAVIARECPTIRKITERAGHR